MINVNKSKRGGNSLNQKKLSKKIQRIYRQAFVYFLWIRKWGKRICVKGGGEDDRLQAAVI